MKKMVNLLYQQVEHLVRVLGESLRKDVLENQFPVLIVVLVQSGKLMEWINVVHPMMIYYVIVSALAGA